MPKFSDGVDNSTIDMYFKTMCNSHLIFYKNPQAGISPTALPRRLAKALFAETSKDTYQ